LAEIHRTRNRGWLVGPGEKVGMRDGGFVAPSGLARRLQRFERGGKDGRRGVDRKMRAVDAAEFFDSGKHVHQGLARRRNVEKGVTARGHFAQPPADEQDEIGGLYTREEFGIGADAEIAGIAGMLGVDEMGAAKGGRDRQREAMRETRDGRAGGLRPAAAAEK